MHWFSVMQCLESHLQINALNADVGFIEQVSVLLSQFYVIFNKYFTT